MSNLSKYEKIKQNMADCAIAMEYLYNETDENSDFFEPVADAWILFMQAKKEVEKLLAEIDAQFPPDTPTPRI